MTTDAVKRLRDLLGDGSCDAFWVSVKVADLRAVLDRLEAAEKVVEMVHVWEMYQDIERSETMVGQMLKYRERFGGVNDRP